MANLEMGFLFKKKNVTYHLQKYEIFEFVDYTTSINFINSNNDYMYNILGGNNAGIWASDINARKNDEEYYFVPDDIDTAIADNNDNVDFVAIRQKKIRNVKKYYSIVGDQLKALTDEHLIAQLERGQKKSGQYDEEVFEKTSDISSMYAAIKKTIVSQDEQIMQILTALFKNQKVINSELNSDLKAKLKENILVYGSTGTGKTEILKRISNLYDIPIVIEDATSLSETGYQGRDITDMLEDLCLAANGNIDLAERGILVIDEFDKLAEKSGDNQSHVSRSGVQRSLLKLLDGSLFYFKDKQFDTSKLTVVGLGAFTEITNNDDYSHITTDDFMRYGIMRELIGRFSKTIPMNPLKKEDIIKILKNSDFSPLNTYKKLFEILKVNFEFNDEFIEYIAELAMEKQSGARSLKTVFDDCISSALFRIFAGEYSGITLVKPADKNSQPYVLTKTKEKKFVHFKRK